MAGGAREGMTMALSPEQQNQIVRLLQRESRNEISAILRSASSLLAWLADVVDAASDLWRRIRAAAAELWQNLRSMFI